jgi:hypothetical protein
MSATRPEVGGTAAKRQQQKQTGGCDQKTAGPMTFANMGILHRNADKQRAG